tara:strand:+ start:18137 stop:18733 length:597 start_codon:yes stop_codon:yes gene_type:complete
MLAFALFASLVLAQPALGVGLEPGTYILQEFGVVIEAKKANGKDWDRSASKPDPSITLRLNEKTVGECKHRDLLEVRCEVGDAIRIDGKSVFALVAVDSDLVADDNIGEGRLAQIHQTGVTDKAIAMEVDGQLASAYLILQRPPPPPVVPTWLGTHQSRLIGLSIGILVGLMLLFGFKSFWFRPRNVRARNDEEGEAA